MPRKGNVRLRAFCIMSLRVTISGKVKPIRRSRSESESEMGVQSEGVDPKPDDLSMARMKGG